MNRLLTAAVIAGCASVFFASLPADARLAGNGLALKPTTARLAGNGLALKPTTARLAGNGVSAKGLDLSRIGQKALGK